MFNLQQIAAFNIELDALIEAGIPLGLNIESDRRAGIGAERLNGLIAQQLAHGCSLSEAIQQASLPPTYRALVEAGIRTERLPTLLEVVSRHSGILPRYRDDLRSVLVYPAFVLMLAGVLLAGYFVFCFPILQKTYSVLAIEPLAGLRGLELVRNNPWLWVWLPSLAFVGRAWRFWVVRTQANRSARSSPFLPRWIPSASRIEREVQSATFADTLAVLVEHEVSQRDAVLLAGQLCGSSQILETANAWVGEQQSSLQFAPFLSWAVFDNWGTSAHADVLRSAADTYRASAEARMVRLRTYIPAIACVVVGGTATLLYALSLFLPLVQLFVQISYPVAPWK